MLANSDLQPLARIAIWVLTGYLLSNGADPKLVEFLRADPQVVALVLAVLNTVWWQSARFFGWRT